MGDQYSDVSDALMTLNLHPFHLIITESLEYLVDEILAGFPCRRRPREKSGARLELGQTPTTQQQASLEQVTAEEALISVKRTFICVSPKYRNPDTVVQSTTEALN